MKLNDALVSDVLEVIATDADGKEYFFGLTTSNEIAQAVEIEKLKAGIGNTTWEIMKTSKEMTVSVAYAAASDELMELQTGGAWETATVEIGVKETGAYVTATGIAITGTPKVTAVTVIEAVSGERHAGVWAAGKVTVALTPPANGTTCHVLYTKELATQEILPFRGDEFPGNLKLSLHGIAKKKNVVIADIYYIFHNASPSGNFTKSFQNGAPDPETIEFDIVAKDGTTDYGFYTVVERV